VENFFSKLTRQRIRRGVFRSIVDLQTAINAYLAAGKITLQIASSWDLGARR
jgi:hypothetical protein